MAPLAPVLTGLLRDLTTHHEWIDHSRDKRDRSAGQQQLAGILTQIIQGKSVSHQVRSHVQARDLGSMRQALKKRLYGTGRKGTVPITEKQRIGVLRFFTILWCIQRDLLCFSHAVIFLHDTRHSATALMARKNQLRQIG